MHKHRTLNSACAITNEFDSPDVYGTLLNSEMSIENSSSPALWLPVLLQRRYRPTKVLESSKGLISATSTILPATIEHNNSASVVPWTTNPLTFREYYTICIYYAEIPDLTSLSLALSFSCALYSIYFVLPVERTSKRYNFLFYFFSGPSRNSAQKVLPVYQILRPCTGHNLGKNSSLFWVLWRERRL